MTTSVIIVTLNRADCVRRCLECLRIQQPPPEQVIVVDASKDTLTRDVVADFPEVEYLRNDNGYGRMTASRNIGLKASTGDIIAFLDDDAFAHDGWLAAIEDTYRQYPNAGAVGGRALNNQPGEAKDGVDRVGQLTSNGLLLGFFAADPGKTIKVDHIMGCNMSFRRNVLIELGGFREDYPGISGVREDSDMCLRVGRAGYPIYFNPQAVATHIGAPQAKGKRFDTRYNYYAARNHIVLLLRNFGPLSGMVWRYLLWVVGDILRECAKRLAALALRTAVVIYGTFTGILSGAKLLLTLGRNPARRDPEADEIRAKMKASTITVKTPEQTEPQPV